MQVFNPLTPLTMQLLFSQKENEGEKSLQQTDQTEKDKQQDDEGLQQTEQAFQETETNEVLQHSDEGETKEKDR